MGLTATVQQSALQDSIAHHLIRRLPKLFPVNPQVLVAVPGRYQDSDGVVRTIRVDSTHIFTQGPGEPEYEQMAISKDRFSRGF